MKSLITNIINVLRYPLEVKVTLWIYQGEIAKEDVFQTCGKAIPPQLLDLVLIQAKDCLPSGFFNNKRTCYYSYTSRCRIKDNELFKSPLCKAHLKFEDRDFEHEYL